MTRSNLGIHLNARWYDPQLRRFISPDPVTMGSTGTERYNPYWAVRFNPLRFVDPDGREAIAAIMGGTMSAGFNLYDQYNRADNFQDFSRHFVSFSGQKEFWVHTGTGALGGMIGTTIASTGWNIATQVVASVLSSGIINIVEQKSLNQKVDINELKKSALIGGLSYGINKPISGFLQNVFPSKSSIATAFTRNIGIISTGYDNVPLAQKIGIGIGSGFTDSEIFRRGLDYGADRLGRDLFKNNF